MTRFNPWPRTVSAIAAFCLLPGLALAQNHTSKSSPQISTPRPSSGSGGGSSVHNSGSSHESGYSAPARPPREPEPPVSHSSAPPSVNTREPVRSEPIRLEPAHIVSRPEPAITPSPAPARVAPPPTRVAPPPARITPPSMMPSSHPVSAPPMMPSHSGFEPHHEPSSPAGRVTPPAHIISPSHIVPPSRVVRPARIAEVRRPDGARVVVVGHSRGFVEHPIATRPGFYSRTYVANGRPYVSVYRQAAFRGVSYPVLVPRIYFAPPFYAWVANPWASPIYFNWGWNTAPWYGYYGNYFAPAPAYANASLWLTDYLLSENLRLAYENQQAQEDPGDLGQQAAEPSAPAQSASIASQITPEMRQLIATAVRQDLDAERAQAAAPTSPFAATSVAMDAPPPALDPNARVIVVSMELNVPLENGAACRLTPGDILYRNADQPGPDGQVGVTVLSSKSGSCPSNSATAIDLATLQEMHNDFRQQIGAGLAVLARNQGRGGLPVGPAAAPRLTLDGDAPVDLDAANALQAEEQVARLNGSH